nr:transposase [Vibrio splendidus]
MRPWVKLSRWILLKNRRNLNARQDSYLTEMLNINKDLMTTYILGAQLKELWYCESEVHANGSASTQSHRLELRGESMRKLA